MSKIRPKWPAEATDRLQAADGLIARDSDEDEEEEVANPIGPAAAGLLENRRIRLRLFRKNRRRAMRLIIGGHE